MFSLRYKFDLKFVEGARKGFWIMEGKMEFIGKVPLLPSWHGDSGLLAKRKG